jgi:rubredoxin/hemerythrin-like domain-containing protein
MREHRLIERMVNVINKELNKINKQEDLDHKFVDVAVDFFKTYADKCHHGKEEDILFKKLKTKNLVQEHLKTINELINEHAYARKVVTKLKKANQLYANRNGDVLNEIKSLLEEIVTIYPKHIEKEDKHFFYPSMDYFSKNEKDVMLDDFLNFDRKMIHEKYEVIVAEKEEKKSQTAKSTRQQSQKWKCTVCGYVYDPEKGDPEHNINPGTRFEDLPEEWVCPICFSPKKAFTQLIE